MAYYFLAVSCKCCSLVPIVEVPDSDNAFSSTTDKSCGGWIYATAVYN